ncbi:hypothetical protein KDA82_31055 [Streptomyces daliensis]|uniref:Uncharacterized protein n=1 Tax=Streptomyces daliensis TaxID=299421 RepID=A0A8T4J6T1_9ACTN|nr:hypothetical protein [Streptomyces daliensis]
MREQAQHHHHGYALPHRATCRRQQHERDGGEHQLLDNGGPGDVHEELCGGVQAKGAGLAPGQVRAGQMGGELREYRHDEEREEGEQEGEEADSRVLAALDRSQRQGVVGGDRQGEADQQDGAGHIPHNHLGSAGQQTRDVEEIEKQGGCAHGEGQPRRRPRRRRSGDALALGAEHRRPYPRGDHGHHRQDTADALGGGERADAVLPRERRDATPGRAARRDQPQSSDGHQDTPWG